MSGWKRSESSVAAEVRGVLVISVTLEWDFFASTAETRPVEHLFHMTRVQTAAIPHRAASLILV